MPGYNSQRRGTARILPYLSCSTYCLFLCCSVYCLFLCRSVLFVCKCVLYNCHQVATQLQLTNISNIYISNIYISIKSAHYSPAPSKFLSPHAEATNIALTFKYCNLNNHSSTATQLTVENT
jgi:hypothetical protein